MVTNNITGHQLFSCCYVILTGLSYALSELQMCIPFALALSQLWKSFARLPMHSMGANGGSGGKAVKLPAPPRLLSENTFMVKAA